MNETERLRKLQAVARDIVRQPALDVIYASDAKLKIIEWLFPTTASGLAKLAQGIIELDTVLKVISDKPMLSDQKKLNKLEAAVVTLLQQDILDAIYKNNVKLLILYVFMRKTAQALAQLGVTLTRLRDIYYNLPPTLDY